MTGDRLSAVIFDVGGVLLEGGEARGRAHWQRRLRLADGELESIAWKAIGSRGASDKMAIVASLAGATRLSSSEAAELLEDFHGHWRPVRELLAFIATLRTSHKVGILANVGAAGRFGFEHILRLHELADVMVLSAEVGLEKPDPAIYHLVADRLGVPAEQCLFIDDLAENIEGAHTVGMRAFRHVSPSATIERVSAELATSIASRDGRNRPRL